MIGFMETVRDSQSLDRKLAKVMGKEKKYNDYEYPRVSLTIPIYNNAEKLSLTLDSILDQIYPDFEIIFIDAGSTDRSQKVVQYYRDDRIHLYTVSSYQRYEMLNRGISLATGDYVNCLFPGDFYIHKHALHEMMELALDHKEPDLVYCGTLLRDGKTDPKILLRPLSLELLKRGQQPTSLQSCWFRTETIRNIGKFGSDFNLRGGFELMCRFMQNGKLRHVSTTHVLTDYDLRKVTRTMVIQHFQETFQTIWINFGWLAALKWLMTQKDISRLFHLWLRSVKMAFFGR